MYFINLFIHTDLIPTKIYDFEELRIMLYPSNKQLPESKYYKPRTLTGLVIKGEKEEFSDKIIKEKVTKFLVFSNFIFPSQYSVRWLTEFEFINLENELKPIDELEKELEANQEILYENIIGMYRGHEIYSTCTLLPHVNRSKMKVNFQELLLKFWNLKSSDSLYQQISLFALAGNTPTLLNPFYENSNLEISLLFSIIDSLIDEFDPNQTVIKRCENCDFEKSGRKNVKSRIKDFVAMISAHKETQETLYKILYQHYLIRNDFFHEAKIVELNTAIDSLIEKIGTNYVSLENDIKNGQARLSGLIIIKEFIQFLLIDKLKKIQPR